MPDMMVVDEVPKIVMSFDDPNNLQRLNMLCYRARLQGSSSAYLLGMLYPFCFRGGFHGLVLPLYSSVQTILPLD